MKAGAAEVSSSGLPQAQALGIATAVAGAVVHLVVNSRHMNATAAAGTAISG